MSTTAKPPPPPPPPSVDIITSDEDDGYDSSSSSMSHLASSQQENIPPSSEPFHVMGKRLGSQPLPPSKRSKLSPGASKAAVQAHIESKVFQGKALNVRDFDTFISPEDRIADEISAKEDVKIPKEELQNLIDSIPLDEENDESQDIQDILMATIFLKCKPDKLGNPVMPGMKVSLMPHQLKGVKWMIEKENKPELGRKAKFKDTNEQYRQAKVIATVGGGILADDMGLGKTIQSIAVMVHNRPDPDEPVKTTLIVAPLALIHQWKREILRRTKKSIFKVFIHHGSNRLTTRAEFLQYDVVITTYGTLMQQYPSNKIPKKKGMKDAEKRMWEQWLEEKKGVMFRIEWYRIILDEAHIIKNPHVRCSLACGALKASRKWVLTGTPVHNELKDLYPLFRFLEMPVFHAFKMFREEFQRGNARSAALKIQVLLRGHMLRRRKDDKVGGKPLIVLPEKTIDRIFIEFTEEERKLYAGVEARAIKIINKYLRDDTVMKNYSSILAMLVRLRQLCIHPYLIMEHMQTEWSVEDLNTVVSGRDPDQATELSKLIDDIAGTPAGDWKECPLCLDAPQNPVMTVCRHVYCADCIDGVFDMPAARGVAAGEEDVDAEIEELGESIACPVCRHKLAKTDIGKFTPPTEKTGMEPETEPKTKVKVEITKKVTKKEEWVIPDDSDSDGESLPDLAAEFKTTIVKKEEKTIKVESKMPIISMPENEDEDDIGNLFDFFKNNPVGAPKPKVKSKNTSQYWQDVLDAEDDLPSSKLETLFEKLKEWRSDHPDDKILIFSQFVRALDLVEKLCIREGWAVGRYQGDMNVEEREASLREFEDDDECCILLTSLKCGGVGLNLTAANRVVCLDLWWNWQIENQAIDRAHRTGQKKPVAVARIIVKNTVEERILALQEQKIALADAALGDEPAGRVGRLSVTELVGLFGTLTKGRYGEIQIQQ